MELGEFPGLIPGKQIEIWHMRQDFFREGICGDLTRFDRNNLPKTHVLVGTIGGVQSAVDQKITRVELLCGIYMAMQSENYSPNGEANDLIGPLGTHTSMSTSDLVRFVADDDVRMVMSEGWRKF